MKEENENGSGNLQQVAREADLSPRAERKGGKKNKSVESLQPKSTVPKRAASKVK